MRRRLIAYAILTVLVLSAVIAAVSLMRRPAEPEFSNELSFPAGTAKIVNDNIIAVDVYNVTTYFRPLDKCDTITSIGYANGFILANMTGYSGDISSLDPVRGRSYPKGRKGAWKSWAWKDVSDGSIDSDDGWHGQLYCGKCCI